VHSGSVDTSGRTSEQASPLRGSDAAGIERDTRFKTVRWVAETGSTNDDLKALAEQGAPDGYVLVADHQTAGRGRLDRTWEARPGDGLLVSVLLRPELPAERGGLVSSAVALAAVDACRGVAGVEPQIKWPNDLLAPDGPKLAGILAVAAGGAVVVGMGLNVHGGPPGAAWLDDLAGREVDRGALLASWLRRLDALTAEWEEVAATYRTRCATVGRRVAVQLATGQTIEGVAEEVDDAGRLVVSQEGGGRSTVSVGDVTHLR
jgi:BirA family biotin operon repressor/biotin-[acetyl-CoA-carboxylase] ligase